MTILSFNDAVALSDLLRAVQAGAKMRIFWEGEDSAEHPLSVTLRPFTEPEGGFWGDDKDIRDSSVWCSGISERWIKTTILMAALDNIDGHLGSKKPMAIIDWE